MKTWERVLQKGTGWLGIVSFGCFAIFALCMCTPISELMFYDLEADGGIDLLSYMTSQNNIVLILAIVGLLAAAGFFLLRNHIRRTYYISNYVGLILTSAFSIFAALFLIVIVKDYQAKYNALDFDTINMLLPILNPGSDGLSKSQLVFALGYVIAAVAIIYGIACGLLAGIHLVKRIKPRKETPAEIVEETKEVEINE